jgi:hypothetical protein
MGEDLPEDNDVCRRLRLELAAVLRVTDESRELAVITHDPGSTELAFMRTGWSPSTRDFPPRASGPLQLDFGLMHYPGPRSGCRSFSVTGVTVWDLGSPLCEPSRGLAGPALLRYAHRMKAAELRIRPGTLVVLVPWTIDLYLTKRQRGSKLWKLRLAPSLSR